VTGTTGATGPTGSIASYGHFYLISGSVPNGSPIPFTTAINSGITYSGGTITVSNTGLYFITYGISPTNNLTQSTFKLTVNGSNQGQAYYVSQSHAGSFNGSSVNTVILSLTAGDQLQLVSTTGSTVYFGYTANSLPGVFFDIIQLQ
jgi:hypothetical protein